MNARWAMVSLLCLLASGISAEPGSTPVDLELVLSVDVSYSMDMEELQAQRQGYVWAFHQPEIVTALQTGPLGRIAVTYVEWGGSAFQVVPWTVIDGPQTAARFAETLRRQPMRRISFTSISKALAFARVLFHTSGFRGSRRVIDVSGDGPNNSGAPVFLARNTTVAQGIVIDGLPIVLEEAPGSGSEPDMGVYYENCVIGGEGAFLLKVTEISQFAEAILKKLVTEISWQRLSGRPQPRVELAQFSETQPFNCFIGEELHERSIGK